ncbi:MAG: hypothetical protein JSS02_00180 [Planctomycetes bacterium]|nr:hypothetical protein [Planctomycetota bacterium]
MTSGSPEQIWRYLDGEMSADEESQFQEWLRASSDNAREFAQITLLHDRLRTEHLLDAVVSSAAHESAATAVVVRRRSRPLAFLGSLAAAGAVLLLLWLGIGRTTVSAASELDRLLRAQSQGPDKTYEITVERVAAPSPRHTERDQEHRPPKPSIDGALLHIRQGNQFVLVRQLPNGQQFLTGCNGQVSWAIRPEGPVRVSQDLSRFNRDVPGHEQGMPLFDVEHDLEQLRTAYDVQLLPVENGDDAASEQEPTRLIVAVKKRGYRGPQRVEIAYAVRSGRIHQWRFVDMPYGPERLTLRLTLTDEAHLGPAFFDHATHHAPDRTIAEE